MPSPNRLLGVFGACAGLASCLVSFEDYPAFDEAPGSGGSRVEPRPSGGASSKSTGGSTTGQGGKVMGDGGEPEPQGGEPSASGGTSSGGSSSGGTTTSGGIADGASAGEADGGEPVPAQGGSPTGGTPPTGGAMQGGMPPTGGTTQGGAPSGGQPSGGAPQGGATGGTGSEMCTDPLRGSCSNATLEYCIEGTWVPNDECGSCSVLSCELECCAAIHAFVADPTYTVRSPQGVTMLYRNDPSSVSAGFAFDSLGQIGGVTFVLTYAQSINVMDVNTGYGGGDMDVALESDFGESGCAYPVLGIQVQLENPISCWGNPSAPVTQVTVRLTNNGTGSGSGSLQVAFVGVNANGF